MTRLTLIAALLLVAIAPQCCDAQRRQFELKDGDRVVFLGSEFTEQAIKHNYFEAELTARWPDRRASFFNMGWSGDTPSAIARGYFGGADEGFRRLSDELDRIKPTVVFLAYGCNFQAADTQQFATDFKKLVAKVNQHTDRVVIVTPPPLEVKPLPRPPASFLNKYRKTVARYLRFQHLSTGSGSKYFVNLYEALERRMKSPTSGLTTDGLRLNAQGYEIVSRLMLRLLNVPATDARKALSSQQMAQLRDLIAEKNRLYFHRYRPQNETYLRGFRKHEQGQNAKEIAEFDALIAQAEDRIYALVNGKPLPEAIPEPAPIQLSFEAMKPEAELAEFTVADGLEVSLFAAEPLVANPIHMNFDGKGRLWVATSPIYPHIKPGAKPRDEILILEDTDGDGVADKKTVFADDLLIPTAVLPDERGGAYVANSTELLHLEDRDGDGKADRRRVLLAGFGTEDTHHILHTFRWGPDGAVYFNQSIYIHTHVETPFGVRRLMGSGIWRYRPETGVAEVVMRGLVNPWGHVFDQFGQSFATDGAGGDGINYAFLGSAYPSAVGIPKVMRGLNPGQPKHCGLEIITGRHWPEEWQGTLVTNDFRGNRINRFRLSEEGSGYVSTQLPDLLTSKHRAFRPVDVKIGPDNTLFIADWYNPIINHGEVDFRDSRRDYKHGRIWRVSVKGSSTVREPDFAKAAELELLKMQESPELRTRHMARVELAKRLNFSVGDALATWKPTDEAGLLEKLWSSEATRRVDTGLLQRLLASSDHRIRAAAVRALGHFAGSIKEPKRLLEIAVIDKHPQVRLEALGALRAFPATEAAELAMRVMDQPMDKWLDYGLWVTMRELEDKWLPVMANGTELAFQKDSKKLLFALRAIGSSSIADPLVSLVSSGKLSPDDTNRVIGLLGQYGQGKHLATLFDVAQKNEANRVAALNALIQAARQRKAKPDGELTGLLGLAKAPQAFELAGLWKFEPMRPQVQGMARSGRGPARFGAIRGLAGFRDAATLTGIASGNDAINVRRSAIGAMATFNESAAAKQAVTLLKSLNPNQAGEAQQLVGVFVARRNGPRLLAAALKGSELAEPIATAGLRRASSAGRNGRVLVDAFRKTTSTASRMKTKLSADELKQLIADVQSNGDAARGESVYRRKELSCIKCHAIGGAGGIVGPDMLSLGASSPMDYIIQSMLEPSAKIKEGYHTTTVVTEDGRSVSGKLISEDDDKLVLRDAENTQVVISKDSIDEQVKSETSLMPVDLVAKLPRRDFVDLIAFLSSLGKEGPYKVPTNQFARRWVLQDGSVVFSRVDGSLPMSDVSGSMVTIEIEVTTAGSVALAVADHTGLRITRNELMDNLRAAKIVQDLPVGRHQFHFRVGSQRKTPMKVEILSGGELTGRAVPVNRK